jgi:hypothetical protein
LFRNAAPLPSSETYVDRHRKMVGPSISISAVAAVAAALLLAHPAAAFPAYVPLCPNGKGVPGVAAIGHVAPAGGGANNKFGIAFAANAHVRRDARARARAPRLQSNSRARVVAGANARASASASASEGEGGSRGARARATLPPYLRARR